MGTTDGPVRPTACEAYSSGPPATHHRNHRDPSATARGSACHNPRMAVSTDAPLPHWDTSAFFPSVGDRAFGDAHERMVADLARLRALYDARGIGGGPPHGPGDAAAADEVLEATNALMAQVRLVSGYLYTLVSTDARDDEANDRYAALQQQLADLTRLRTRLDAWVARTGADVVASAGPVAAEHRHVLARADAAARHQLSPAEEDLVADLRLTGSAAWARLHRDVTARLTAEVDGARLPMSVVRGLAHDPDPAVRAAAYEGELAAWAEASVPLAAALNGAVGERVVLNRRRGWDDDLEPALFHNGVDRVTFEAMTGAVVDALPAFRRYLQAKARLLGHGPDTGLPWWDLFAPVSSGGAVLTIAWDEAVARVTEAFAGYSPALAGLARRAVEEGWIDAEPRDGKVGGAFCLPVRGGESRVLLNFDGSFGSVQTLAHELGHAFHNANLAERTPLQRQTPMALAETASIFCETVLVDAGLRHADDQSRLTIIDTDLQGATQVVVDIHSRFLFESELCRRRADGPRSVAELDELMLDCQEQAYGDGLDPGARHPSMWAVKGHYYTPFYNWPYTFGLLFGIGLFARYQQDPDRFRAGYDELLSATGMDDAAGLAARFAIDVRDPAFWADGLAVLTRRITDFDRLIDAA